MKVSLIMEVYVAVLVEVLQGIDLYDYYNL
jgi:hypothetical protein